MKSNDQEQLDPQFVEEMKNECEAIKKLIPELMKMGNDRDKDLLKIVDREFEEIYHLLYPN